MCDLARVHSMMFRDGDEIFLDFALLLIGMAGWL